MLQKQKGCFLNSVGAEVCSCNKSSYLLLQPPPHPENLLMRVREGTFQRSKEYAVRWEWEFSKRREEMVENSPHFLYAQKCIPLTQGPLRILLKSEEKSGAHMALL